MLPKVTTMKKPTKPTKKYNKKTQQQTDSKQRKYANVSKAS